MSNEPDLTKLDDDQLINERAFVRDKLEALPVHVPRHAAQRAILTELFTKLDDEFICRARAAWSKAER
jgi:hypothetical protein